MIGRIFSAFVNVLTIAVVVVLLTGDDGLTMVKNVVADSDHIVAGIVDAGEDVARALAERGI